MWLTPRKIWDNCLGSGNKAYVFYLLLSSHVSLYLLIDTTPFFFLCLNKIQHVKTIYIK